MDQSSSWSREKRKGIHIMRPRCCLLLTTLQVVDGHHLGVLIGSCLPCGDLALKLHSNARNWAFLPAGSITQLLLAFFRCTKGGWSCFGNWIRTIHLSLHKLKNDINRWDLNSYLTLEPHLLGIHISLIWLMVKLDIGGKVLPKAPVKSNYLLASLQIEAC